MRTNQWPRHRKMKMSTTSTKEIVSNSISKAFHAERLSFSTRAHAGVFGCARARSSGKAARLRVVKRGRARSENLRRTRARDKARPSRRASAFPIYPDDLKSNDGRNFWKTLPHSMLRQKSTFEKSSSNNHRKNKSSGGASHRRPRHSDGGQSAKESMGKPLYETLFDEYLFLKLSSRNHIL